MSVLDTIKEPIQKELKEFEQTFHYSMKSDIPLLNIVINYIIRRKGKQIRPILFLVTVILLTLVTSFLGLWIQSIALLAITVLMIFIILSLQMRKNM